MLNMHRVIVLAAGLGWSLSAAAQDKPPTTQPATPPAATQPAPTRPGQLSDTREILQKADSATRAVDTVRYQVEFSRGTDKPEVTGKVILAGESAQALDRYYMELKIQEPPRELTLGSDGKQHWAIDPKTKKVHAGNLDALGSSNRLLNAGALREFVHPTPFADELNGLERTLRGVTKVGGEECYEVYVKYRTPHGAPPQSAVWYFSTRDFLPRRVDRDLGADGKTRHVLTNLEANPKLDKNPFELKVPDGYEKVATPLP